MKKREFVAALDASGYRLDASPLLPGGRLHYVFMSPERIYLYGDTVKWQWGTAQACRRPYSKCLADLLTVDGRPNSAVVEFIRRWGPLAIWHEWRDGIPPVEFNQPLFTEPVSVYFELSKQAATILDIATKLKANKRASRDDWATIHTSAFDPHHGAYSPPVHMRNVSDQGDALMGIVNEWLSSSGVHPYLTWDHGSPHLGLSWGGNRFLNNAFDHASHTRKPMMGRRRDSKTGEYADVPVPYPSKLWGKLACDLAAVIARPGSMRACERVDCHELYQANHHLQRYCSDYCKHEAEKARKRRWAERSREQISSTSP